MAGAAVPCQSQSTAWEGACSRPASLGTPALPTDSRGTPVGPSLISARPPGPLMITQSPHSKLEEPPLRALREEPCPSPAKLGEAPGNPHSPCSPHPPHTCVWRRHLHTEELPAPAAGKPPGWVFHPPRPPPPCPSSCSCPFSSLADKHHKLPALPMHLSPCPGRTTVCGPFAPSSPGPEGHVAICKASPRAPGSLRSPAPRVASPPPLCWTPSSRVLRPPPRHCLAACWQALLQLV